LIRPLSSDRTHDDLHRIDTSGRAAAECVAELAALVEELRRLRAAA
jgi:hypothetical protein